MNKLFKIESRNEITIIDGELYWRLNETRAMLNEKEIDFLPNRIVRMIPDDHKAACHKTKTTANLNTIRMIDEHIIETESMINLCAEHNHTLYKEFDERLDKLMLLRSLATYSFMGHSEYEVAITIDGETFSDAIIEATPQYAMKKAIWNWPAASKITLTDDRLNIQFTR